MNTAQPKTARTHSAVRICAVTLLVEAAPIPGKFQ